MYLYEEDIKAIDAIMGPYMKTDGTVSMSCRFFADTMQITLFMDGEIRKVSVEVMDGQQDTGYPTDPSEQGAQVDQQVPS